MDEFTNRMAAQRHVLNVVNKNVDVDEELFGLSSNAIDRWLSVNKLGSSSELGVLIKKISTELFFMATRSQEPVSAEYHLRSERILHLVVRLEDVV